jgi:sugar/nucleoside kinase (ribokinase family)
VRPSTPPRHDADVPAEVTRHRGGSAANVAAAAVRAGGAGRFIGRVGDDGVGAQLVDELTAEGVDVRVERGGRTGTIVVLVDPDGARTMCSDRAAAAELSTVPSAWLDDVAVLHVPLYGLLGGPTTQAALGAVAEARARGIPVSLGLASSVIVEQLGAAGLADLLARIAPTIVVGDAAEVEAAGWDGPPVPGCTLVATAGRNPTRVVGAPGGTLEIPVPVVEAVADSTGAGDAFCGALLVVRAGGGSWATAVEVGHAAAAGVLRGAGAVGGRGAVPVAHDRSAHDRAAVDDVRDEPLPAHRPGPRRPDDDEPIDAGATP